MSMYVGSKEDSKEDSNDGWVWGNQKESYYLINCDFMVKIDHCLH